MLPLYQKYITGGLDSYFQIPLSPSPSTSSLNSGNTVYFDLEPHEVNNIDDLLIRLKIACSTAAVECVPTPYYFKKIEIIANKGTGDVLGTIYPENFFIFNQITQTQQSRKQIAKLGNWSYVCLNQEGGNEKISINENTKYRVGETKHIYLSLPWLPLHLNAIDMRHIRTDLRFRFELSSDIIVSGSSSNLSLDGFDMFVRSYKEEDYDKETTIKKHKSYKNKYIFLDCERLQENNKTLTASAQTRYNLEQFVGKSPFIVCCVKPAATPIASDSSLFNYMPFGRDTTIDLTNSGSQSLLGNGQALPIEYIENTFQNETGNPPIEGLYFIPFCEDMKTSCAGKMDGYFDFNGSNDYLEVNWAAAPTAEVHNIAIGTTFSSGSYRAAFTGNNNGFVAIDDGDLAFDASSTAIATAINAMPAVKERKYTVSASSDFNAAASVNFTWNVNSGKVSEELGNLTILCNTDSSVSSSSVGTYGKKGLTTGSGYMTEIFLFKYRELIIDQKGNLTVKDL
jgi:hypothetical protein